MTETTKQRGTGPGGSSPPDPSERIVTGVDAAQVYVDDFVKGKDGELGEGVRAAIVMRGEPVPARAIEGELERLEAMGAFDPQTQRERRMEARRKAHQAAEAARQATELPPSPAEERGEVGPPKAVTDEERGF